MITTIIITALASVFITLVVGYFIWSGIGARKLKKQVKDNKNGIIANAEHIKSVEDHGFQGRDEIHKRIEDEVKNVYESIVYENNSLNEKIEELHQKIDDIDNQNHRELDRRFDKVYENIRTFYENKK